MTSHSDTISPSEIAELERLLNQEVRFGDLPTVLPAYRGHLRALLARVRELEEALRASLSLIDDALAGKEFDDGVYLPGVTDVELTPDGKYMLSQARAALPEEKP